MSRIRVAAFAVAALVFTTALSACAKHENADQTGAQLPIYPHATEIGVSPKLSAKNTDQTLAIYTTWDSFDKVRAWYQAQLPPQTQSAVNEKRHEATFALFDGRTRTVHIEVSGGQVVIYLSAAAPGASGR